MQLIFFILFTYIIKVLSAQLLRSIQIFLAVLAQINSINKKTQQWLSLPTPLLIFDHYHPLGTNFFLSPAFHYH